MDAECPGVFSPVRQICSLCAVCRNQIQANAFHRLTKRVVDARERRISRTTWYESGEAGLGLELVSEIREATDRALKNPEFISLTKNNYAIFFSDGAGT